MIANSADRGTLTRTMARLTIAAGLAATAGIILTAAAAPVRLVAVTRQGEAVLIEATEPVAYSVSRPDALSLVVDMRNVSVSDARAEVERQGAIAGVRLEQASGADGRALARVHVNLAKPSEYVVRSARNMIRIEPKSGASKAAAVPASTPAAMATAPAPATPLVPSAPPRTIAPAPEPAAAPQSAPAKRVTESIEKTTATPTSPHTVIERITTSKTAAATTVTLVGNGRLEPVGVTESKDRPRRLVLDFPNTSSTTPSQVAVDSPLVSRVRVAINSHQPLVTRVVMEIAPTASYHVENAGEGGRDVAVVFEQARPANTVVMTPAEVSGDPGAPEPPISLQQAMANVASITAPDPAAQPLDPMMALKTAVVSAPVPPAAAAPREAAAPARTSTPALVRPSARSSRQNLQSRSRIRVPFRRRPDRHRRRKIRDRRRCPRSSRERISHGSTPGDPLSLDLDGVDLRAVLRTFADVSGLNMVIDPDVQGTVDIKLTDVPWDQALDIILRGNQLDYSVDGTIVRISKIRTLEDENKTRQAAAQAQAERQAQAGGLSFETFPLSYAKAADMVPLLKGSLRLSKYGQVQFDARTNTLIIADLPEQFPAIRQLLTTLDRAEPQVEIEARIITTTREFARAIGVQWGLNGRMTPQIGNTTNLAFPNSIVGGGRVGGGDGTAVNLPVPGAPSAIGVALGAVNGAFNLDVALSALERSGKGRVLSTPRVTTQNNVEAEIMQGVQIPLVTPSTPNSPETVTYKDAALTLRVTPQITAANTVIMQIMVENASPGEVRGNNVQIDTQRANTRVQVTDGTTTVMGGVFIARETSAQDRTPALYRLPLLGWLFKRDTTAEDSRELLIFITPRILKG